MRDLLRRWGGLTATLLSIVVVTLLVSYGAPQGPSTVQQRGKVGALGGPGFNNLVQQVQGVSGGVPIPITAPTTGLPIVPEPASTPATYIDAGTGLLTGDTGATWLSGPTLTVPAGARGITWVITYQGGGSGAQLSYRIRAGHASNSMGVTRIRNSSPSISGSVANQAEYTNTITASETGATVIYVPVPFDVSGGYAFVALDLQEVASAVDAGIGTATWAVGY